MEKFIDDQRRKNQTITALNFGLHDANRRCIRRMIRQGELNEDVAVQPASWPFKHFVRDLRLGNHRRKTRWPLSG